MIVELMHLHANIIEHRIFSINRSGGADTRTKCTLFYVWAAGRGPTILTKEAGFLVEQKSTVIILEVRNGNADSSFNTRDSSGVGLHLSYNRFTKAGVLQLADGSVSKNA